MDSEKLTEFIRSAGILQSKGGISEAVTAWYAKERYRVSTVREQTLDKLRAEPPATKGVGRETAAPYTFGFLTFVMDAYTDRLCGRYPLEAGKGYKAVKAILREPSAKERRGL